MVPFHSCLAALILKTPAAPQTPPLPSTCGSTGRTLQILILFSTLLAATPGLPSLAAAETHSPVAAWLAAQKDLSAWSADFVQTRTLKSLTQPLTAKGHVWFAAPNRFRWELYQPATIAVRARDEMLVITPGLKRVERYPLDQAGPWRDALALLEAGFPRSQADLDSRFRVVSQTITNEVCELTLQPKSAAARKMMPRIKIAFHTANLALRATELEWADGSTMRNDFTNAVVNPTLDPSLFNPTIESDYKVVEPLKPNR
jgi:outer membrane lipoprotein-sorting protein